MKILLISNVRTSDANLKNQLLDFNKRLSHYLDFNRFEIPSLKSSNKLSKLEYKNQEAKLIKKQIFNGDYIVLLDEKGKTFTSVEFSKKIEKYMLNSYKRIVFIIGGAFGFSDQIYSIANEKISLSKMTFSHQMVRLFFMEQLYRAYTILRNEKYHNQ